MAERNIDRILQDAEYYYHPNIVADFRIYMAQYRLLCDDLEAGKITAQNVNAYNRSLDFLEAEMYRLCPAVIPDSFPRVRAQMHTCLACNTIYGARPCPKCFPNSDTHIKVCATHQHLKWPCAVCGAPGHKHHWIWKRVAADTKVIMTPGSVAPSNWVRDTFYRTHKPATEKCIHCGMVLDNGKCPAREWHTMLQTEEVVGCVGGIFCCCIDGWGHKSPWRGWSSGVYSSFLLAHPKYASPAEEKKAEIFPTKEDEKILGLLTRMVRIASSVFNTIDRSSIPLLELTRRQNFRKLETELKEMLKG